MAERPSSADFEFRLILAIIHNARFREYVLSAVKSDFFTVFEYQFIYELIYAFRAKKKAITFFSIYEAIRRDTRLSDERAAIVCEVLKPYIDIDHDGPTLDAVVDGVVSSTEEIVKGRLIQEALVDASDFFENDNYDEAIILWNKVSRESIYRTPCKLRMWEEIERNGGNIAATINYREGVRTGIKGKDKVGNLVGLDSFFFNRGLPRGELGIVLGDSGRGKTTFTLNMALYQSLAGFNVDYYSLEMPKEYLQARAISALTGVATDDIISEKKKTKVERELAIIKEKYPEKREIELYHYNSNELTVNLLSHNVMMSQREGRNVDVVIVDYLDLMKCEHNFREMHHRIGQNAIDFRAAADEYDFMAFSPSQANRGTFQEKKAGKGRQNIAGDISKLFTSGLLLILNEHIEEKTTVRGESKEQKEIWCYVDKNRFGKHGQTLKLYPNEANARYFDIFPKN